MSVQVLLVTHELATTTAVAAALESNGRLRDENICRDLGELSARLDRQAAGAVLVDIDPQPADMLGRLDPLIRKFPDTRFVILAGLLRSDLMLEAMQAGARHFMVKPSIASDLSGVLRRLCPDEPANHQGRVVTVLSAGGGAGATTLAVNLANEMQLHTREPALLMDLDCNHGSAAACLGVDGEYGLVDLLDRTGPIDGQLIQTTAVTYSEQLQVLICMAGSRLGEAVRWDGPRLVSSIKAARGAYRSTVVDAARAPIDVMAELVKAGDVAFLVLQSTVRDIQSARLMLSALRRRGVDDAAVRPLVNRFHKRRMNISLEETAKALGDRAVEKLSNDFQAAYQALNLGQPLAEAAGRSDLRRDLQKLAMTLCEAAAQGHSANSGR
jgi:pilus assembly protein CpaE